MIGAVKDVPPALLQLIGAPVQGVPKVGSESQKM
jgi:hypothetical protein